MDKKNVAKLFFNLKRKIEPVLTEDLRNDDEFIELWEDINQELDLDQFQKPKQVFKGITLNLEDDDEDSEFYSEDDEDDPEELEF